MQELWAEYVKVSGLESREEEMNERLGAFLKAFQESEVGNEPGALSNIVDNATDILDALLQFAEGQTADQRDASEVSDTFDKSLKVIEVILRDEQYRQQVCGEWIPQSVAGCPRLDHTPSPRPLPSLPLTLPGTHRPWIP